MDLGAAFPGTGFSPARMPGSFSFPSRLLSHSQSTIMRTLNVKRTVIFLVVVIVVAGSTHLLHSYQLQRNSSSFKTQAEAAWNDNPRRDSDAFQLMRAYLVLEPQDYEAREELGFWYADSGRFAIASSNPGRIGQDAREARSAGRAEIQEVRRKLIDAAMAQGRCADAVDHLEILKEELPDDADVLNLLGKVPDHAGARRRGHRELFRSDPTETRSRRHLLQQGHGLAFSSRAEIGGSREVHGGDDRRTGKTPNRPGRAPRLWHVAGGTGKIRRGLEAGRGHAGPARRTTRATRALSCRAVGTGVAAFSQGRGLCAAGNGGGPAGFCHVYPHGRYPGPQQSAGQGHRGLEERHCGL